MKKALTLLLITLFFCSTANAAWVKSNANGVSVVISPDGSQPDGTVWVNNLPPSVDRDYWEFKNGIVSVDEIKKQATLKVVEDKELAELAVVEAKENRLKSMEDKIKVLEEKE